MSGFEIVGVVLGSIPLLVEGLKTYKHGLETVSSMVNYRKTVDDLILRFGTSASLYIHVCERLVQPLMLEPNEWSELLDNPRNQAWKSQELGHRVQESLGRDFTVFVGRTARLHDRLIKFANNLDLDTSNNLQPKWLSIQQSSQSRLRDKFFSKSNKTWKGMKAGLDNGSLEKALDQIEADLDALDRLLDARDREAPVKRSAKNRAQSKRWHSIRDAACNIYNALAANWSCSSSHNHAASLRLEARKVLEMDSPLRFDVILYLKDQANQPRKVISRAVEIVPKPSTRWNQTPNPSTIQPSTPDVFKISSMAMIPNIQITPVSNSSQTQPTNDVRIRDLCDWQQSQCSPTSSSFGFLEHDVWRHHLYQAKACHMNPASLSHISLHDCVTGNCTSQVTAQSFATELGPREKIHVAAVLASSILQLGQTPWLIKPSWSMQEVFFLDLNRNDNRITFPYIYRDFSQRTNQSSSSISSMPAIENELVFALGVILIELSYAKPLASFKTSKDGDHPYTKLQIASRLVRNLQAREGEKYANAARKCIKCSFDVDDYSFDNHAFQDQFYTGVVLPLQELWDALQ